MRRWGSALCALVISTGGLLVLTAGTAVASGPTVRVGDVTVEEGDVGDATVKVPVDLSGPSTSDIYVPYVVHASSDGTADAADARMKTGLLKFKAGITSMAIAVVVVGDTTTEPDQHVDITLGNPTGAVLADGSGTLDIVDDDANGVNPGTDASMGSTSVEEANSGTHMVYLPVVLSRPATSPVTIVYTIGCSTASFVTDVSAPKTGKITFAAGQRAKTLSYKVKADTTPENNEALIHALSTPTPGVTLTSDTSNTTIVDDDTPGTLNDGVLTDCGHGLPNFAKESLPTSTFDAGAVGDTEQVDVASDGSAPHFPDGESTMTESRWASSSADGSAVVFESPADNLVPGDTNGIGDIFVRDRWAGTTERVSVKADGSQINPSDMYELNGWPSVDVGSHPAISADGRYVAFQTAASLVPADTGTSVDNSGIGRLDVYVYDRQTHTVDLVSQTPAGTAAGGVMFNNPSISAHGRYVTFTVLGGSTALTTQKSGVQYVYVRDRLMHRTMALLDQPAWQPEISADGQTVVVSDLSNAKAPTLVAIDLTTGDTDRIDVTTAGDPGAESQFAHIVFTPSVSEDGRYVGFKSFAWNLIPGRSGPLTNYSGAFPADLVTAYVRDRQARTTTVVPTTYRPFYDGPVSIADGGGRIAVGGWGGPEQLVQMPSGPVGSYGLAQVGSTPLDNRIEMTRALSADGRYVAFGAEVFPSADIYIQRVG